MGCRWLRCTGKIFQAYLREIQQDLPCADAESNAPCVPPYVLQQDGSRADESKNPSIYHGAQRYWRDAEYIYPSGI